MSLSDPHPWPRVQNVLRPLNAEERAGLKASLAHLGVLETIKLLPDGRIIDGHHRYELATELGIPCPSTEHDLAEEEAYRMAVDLNTERRQLTKAERREAIRRTLETQPERTNADIAREHGVTRETVRRAAAEVNEGTNVPPLPRGRTLRKATPEEKRQAWLLAEEGMRQADIAQQLGRPATTISTWLREERPSGRDELERRRHERHLRGQQALGRLVDLNHHALQMWEGHAAIQHAIQTERNPHALVDLAAAISRTQAMLAQLMGDLDARLDDEERQRVAAFLIASGFGT